MIPWDQLNPEQAEAVRAVDERLLVLAPVGTGKTNVLALRTAWAMEQGRDPRQILCLSFTNKAAREMSVRLAQMLGDSRARQVASKTFHGLCASILREEAQELGLDGDFLIYDEEDCRTLWGQVLENSGFPMPQLQRERNELEFFYYQVGQQARLSKWEKVSKPIEVVFRETRERHPRVFLPARAEMQFRAQLGAYMHALRESHALDFADLIDGVNRLFEENAGALRRWQLRFSWIQVDEVQDTNYGEYRVISLLAEQHRNLSFFGDIDQTIYEWRGSDPYAILDEFQRDYAPVREIHLVQNYRSTETILRACERVVRGLRGSVTKRIVAHSGERGEPLEFFEADELEEEAGWIAQRIRALREKHGLEYRDFAVLTRTNFRARDLSQAFTAEALPHIQVDEFKFFQRMEVKDAMAALRLIDNPHDGQSLDRYLARPPKGIGAATMRALRGPVRETGLKLGDLLRPETYRHGDPFAPLLKADASRQLVVFDLETTGTDRTRHEIVEIAARRLGTEERFHRLVRPECGVGDSVSVHGLTEDELMRGGVPAQQAIEEFRVFAGEAVLSGHNVAAFDVPFLDVVSERLGLPGWRESEVFDTLDLVRRFYKLPRYRLDKLAEHFQFKSKPSHRAMDDVETTCELLAVLLDNLRRKETERRAALKKYGDRLEPLAAKMEHWRARAQLERPHELLGRVLEESGLGQYYEDKDEASRVENLKRLVRLMEVFDNSVWTPREALRQAVQLSSLGQDTDQYDAGEDRVALLTVHQAKGLEFDTVFVAHACEDEFPSARSVAEGRLDEEHRLFYVAVSRAKRRLLCTWSRRRESGRPASPSRYLVYLRE